MLAKKCFFMGILTLLSVSLAIAAPPAVHPTTGEPLVIDCLRGTVTIDGDLSDWNLEAMTPAVLDVAEQLFSGQDTWDSPEDSSGEFYLLWDDENIYIAVVMKDDVLSMNKTGGDIWNADAVEIFFSTTNAVADHSEHYQYGFNANNQRWNWCNIDGAGSTEPDYLQIASSVTADGYICEASIPYGQMPSLDFSVGNTIGLHPVFDDTDNGDRELQMTWTGREAHDQSLGFGHIVLSADPAPASAQLIAYEPFDYPANGLSGNDGGSGWIGAWDGGDQQVTAPGLAFSPLLVKGNKATVVGGDSFRNLPEPMGDNETQLWISFVGQADQQPGADMWGGVSFHEPDESLFLGVPWQAGDGDKVWGLDTKGDENRYTEIPITEKIIFVARVDFNTDGDNETVTAWAKSINDTQPLDFTDETAFAQYTTRNIEFSRVRVAGNQPVNIDEIRLSMTPPIELVAQAADIAAIEEVLNQYAVSANAGDLELWLSLHADDVVKMPPDAPAIFGIEDLRANFQPAFDNFNTSCVIYPEEAQVDGDLGFARGTYSILITPKEGGETISLMPDGKYLTILKRQPDGSWKISHDCYNSNVPPPTVE